jgi:phospholipase C
MNIGFFINNGSPYKQLRVYHSIGVGKTLSAISIAEKYKKDMKNNTSPQVELIINKYLKQLDFKNIIVPYNNKNIYTLLLILNNENYLSTIIDIFNDNG